MADPRAAKRANSRTSRPSGRIWLRRAVVAVLIALPWGLIAGLLTAPPSTWRLPPFRWPLPAAHPPVADRPTPGSIHDAHRQLPAPERPAADAPSAGDGEPLRRADALLLAGRYTDAADIYQRLVASQASPSAGLIYRLAVSRELLGDDARARALYQRLARPELGEAIAAAAILGQVRIDLATGRFDLAEPVLAAALLATSAAGPSSHRLAGDIAHLYAQVQARRWLGPDEPDLLAPATLATATPQWAPDHLLDLITWSAPPEPAPGPEPMQVILRFGDLPVEVNVRGHQRNQPIAQLVGSLAELLEVPVVASPATAQLLASRRGTLDTESLAAGTALDALLEPLGLTWELTGDGALGITPIAETDHLRWQQRRLGAAQRALQTAVTAFPEHELAPISYLLLGNLHASQQDWDGALAWYSQAQAQYPLSPYRAEIGFNQAKVHLLAQQPTAAREAFFHVVDGARGHPLEGISYVFLGRLFLDEGETEMAVRPLLRAVAITRPPVQAAAATTLASAYLLADNPHAASLTLVEYKQALSDSPFQTVAAFLASLARFQATSTHGNQLLAGRELIATAAHVRRDHFLGAFGTLVIGKGLRQLGLVESVIRLYEDALAGGAHLSSAVRGRLRLELAEAYELLGDLDSAQRHLETLARERTPWGAEAELRLVELRFRQGDLDECLARCQQLLDERPEVETRERLLRVMGRIYEDQRDHFRAALCFAGLLPGETDGLQQAGDAKREIP